MNPEKNRIQQRQRPHFRSHNLIREALVVLFCSQLSDTPSMPEPPSAQPRETVQMHAFQVSISPDLRRLIGPEGEIALQEVAQAYAQVFGCPHPQIQIVLDDFSEETQELGGGIREHVAEKADSGIIFFDRNNLIANRDSLDNLLRHIQETVLHAMTHACKPTEPKLMPPFLLGDGARVLGVRGFAILAALPDGKRGSLMTIEEGASEALAAILAKRLKVRFTVSVEYYFAIGSFTLALMQHLRLNPVRLAKMVQANDLMGFVGLVFNTSDPSDEQLVQLMTLYEDMREDLDPKMALERVKQMRQR